LVFSAFSRIFCSVYFDDVQVLFSSLAEGLMLIYMTRIHSDRSNRRGDILRQTWSAVTRVDRFYDVPCLKHSGEETPQSMRTSRHQLAETAVLCNLASLAEFGIAVSEIHAGKVAEPCDLSVRPTAKSSSPQKIRFFSIPISNAHVMKRAKNILPDVHFSSDLAVSHLDPKWLGCQVRWFVVAGLSSLKLSYDNNE
jgi:hypothetical protein